MADRLTQEQRDAWDRDGYFLLRGFAEPDILTAMESRVVELVRANAAGKSISPAFATLETKISQAAVHPEDELSKLFRVHREQKVFRDFIESPRLLDRAEALLGPDIDCFLSQFIAKHPGALGQPWHQDSFYFPFDRGPQVGIWLAVTAAREDNGPLWILPGSHLEPTHDVVPDRRPHADSGYVEIVDHDMKGAFPVLLQPGDLLFFHSQLMHRSTDNVSEASRMAMVYHLASAATQDLSQEKWGMTPPNIDWLPVRRSGNAVEDET